MMRGLWLLLVLLCLFPVAEAAYITDKIRVGFYDQPDTRGRPVKVLQSGEEIKVLEQKENVVRVELGDGAKGWVGRQYVVDDMPAVRSLVESRKEVARMQVELEQTRQELLSMQKELAGGGPEGILKDALAAANKQVKELREKLKKKEDAVKTEDPFAACEQQLDTMEAKQLQCQVRLAKYTKDDKDSVAAENEKLRETMQQAVNLLALPPNGDIPVLIPAEAFTTTRTTIVQQQPIPERQDVPAVVKREIVTEGGLPVWIYALLVLTLVTGVIGGFALFDYRSRYRYSIRL